MLQHTAQDTAGETASQTGPGSDYIMEHLLAHPIIELPTIAGVNLTLTTHTLTLFAAAIIVIVAFVLSFREMKRVPSGFNNLLESMTAYVYKDAIAPYLGTDKRYVPYLLSAFFFILVCNFLGLVPPGFVPTGNIAVTITLALFTLVIGQYAGIRKFGVVNYFKNFLPSGIPILLMPLMIPVELLSLVSRHVALAVRLFANMMGGHITILAIMSLIFIFKSWLIAPLPLALVVFSAFLETLIALIQAYVFTTLSAVYIGQSISEEH